MCVNSGLVSMIDILLIVSCIFLHGILWVPDMVNFILLGVDFFFFSFVCIFFGFSWDALKLPVKSLISSGLAFMICYRQVIQSN